MIFFARLLPAQQKIVLEKFRCYDQNTTLTNYLYNHEVRKTIAVQLNKILLQYRKIPLADTTDINVELLDFTRIVPEAKPDFKDKDPDNAHLYIDFVEADPFYFFRGLRTYPADSAMITNVKTVFAVKATLFSSAKVQLSSESVNLLISVAETPGIGIRYSNGIRFTDLAVIPKTFTEILKTGFTFALDSASDMASVQLKVQPAYYSDNFIAARTHGRTRTFVANNKGVLSYQLGDHTELLRLAEPIYEEIRIKGKKAEKYPEQLTAAIKASSNFSGSDYVFLRQEARDVLRDKNYLVKLVTQVNPLAIPADESLLFTNFLSGSHHYLFLEKDTLASFSILKQVTEKTNKVFPDLVYNGYDTASVVRLPVPINRSADISVLYTYVINGSLQGMPFRIKCSGNRNTLKEIFLGDKLVCIAQGKFIPEKFVLFDASLSSEKLNQLFIIGFNRFLE